VRVGIVGSRPEKWANKEWASWAEKLVRQYVRQLPKACVVVSGGAAGVDSWAVDEAKKRGLQTVEHLIDKSGLPPWPKGKKEFRQRAFDRNTKIVNDVDWVVAVWTGESGGTQDTINKAIAAKLPLAIYTPTDEVGNFRFRCTEDDVRNLYLEPREGH
jgi:hypothetical protein